MLKYFLLTYSVTAPYKLDSDIAKANNVRDAIAEVDEWKKLEKVETTFSGIMEIPDTTETEKRRAAKRNVKNVFKPILQRYEAEELDVSIYCAIMVEDMGDVYEFTIVNN
ncbi:hypothetical protein [Enterobacter kobei]|uniref:hypothetical protein n=1 Tax=Enterobacter kobei TaxID=208224 RepID=UPI0006685A23|nr:hypothetical protein [Enterobacter kobei]MCK7343278.1 hypothetical protein [Enterobacter kobei]